MKKNRAPKTTKAAPEEKKGKAKPAKPKKVPLCSQSRCKFPATSQGYCRLHYLANWQQIKQDEKTRAERRLNAYVDRLAKRYPADYLDKIKEGIENEDIFKQTIQQLELDGEEEQTETEREYLEKMLRTIKGED